MSQKTILITGASGVLGRAVLPSLLEKYKILALGTSLQKFPEEIRFHKNFKFYERDFLQMDSQKDLQILESPDFILHLAAVVSGTKATEETYEKINVKSVQIICDFAQEKKSKGVLLASSLSVYGRMEATGKLTLETPIHPKTLYAKTKAKAEDVFFQSRIPGSVFRLASVYGGESKSFVSKLFKVYRFGFFPVFRPEPVKPLLFIGDWVLSVLSWLKLEEKGKKWDRIYLVSDPDPYTPSQILEAFQKHIPKSWLVRVPISLRLFRFISGFFLKWGSPTTQELWLSREKALFGGLPAESLPSWRRLQAKPQGNLAKAWDPIQFPRGQ